MRRELVSSIGDADLVVSNLALRPRRSRERVLQLTDSSEQSGRVVRLRKRTTREGETHAGEFLGIHIVGDDLPRRPEGCLVGDVYLPALERGTELYVVCTEAPAHDIGTMRAYLEANLAWLATTGKDAFVAEGARVSADVTQTIIGARAVVTAPATRAVVWPNTTISEPLSDMIATPFGVFGVSGD